MGGFSHNKNEPFLKRLNWLRCAALRCAALRCAAASYQRLFYDQDIKAGGVIYPHGLCGI
jgi:hypothetical protein